MLRCMLHRTQYVIRDTVERSENCTKHRGHESNDVRWVEPNIRSEMRLKRVRQGVQIVQITGNTRLGSDNN